MTDDLIEDDNSVTDEELEDAAADEFDDDALDSFEVPNDEITEADL